MTRLLFLLFFCFLLAGCETEHTRWAETSHRIYYLEKNTEKIGLREIEEITEELQQQRQELAQYLAYKRLNALNTARAKADLAQGTSSPIMSLGKLAMSRILHEEGRLRTKIAGAQSLFEGEQYPRAEDANFLSLNAYSTSIGGGTDQVQ
ncbi:hypothetical protein OAR95_03605 [Pseudomonadales bacterium]|nr:hypothetical protein [Pseudomonadales bacterium]